MKKLLILPLMLLAIGAFAQSKYSLSTYITPGVSSSRAIYVEDAQQDEVNFANNTQKNGFGYTAGVLINKHVNHKVSWRLGVNYTSYKDKFETTHIDALNSNNEIENYKLATVYNYKYIDVPFYMNYSVYKNDHIDIALTGGLEINIPLTGKATKTKTDLYTNATQTSTFKLSNGFDGADDLNMTYMAGISVSKKVNDKLSLYTQLSYREQLSNRYRVSHITRVNLMYGLSIGATFNIGK